MDNRFRKAIEECVERIRRGDSVQSCLEAYPEYAERLAPFLRAASIMWGARPPEPSKQGMKAARSSLLERVAEGVGKEAVMHGMFKLAQVAAAVVAALFVASMGLVAAAGPGVFTKPFGGDQDSTVAFTAGVLSVGQVVSANETVLFVRRDTDYVYLRLTASTKVEGPHGELLERTSIKQGDRIYTQGKLIRDRLFEARLVRLLAEEPKPTPTPAPKPEPTPAPTPAPVDAPPPPTEAAFEGKIMEVGSGSFVLKSSDGVRTTILYNGDTVFSGSPVVGAFAKVFAWRLADGTILAREVTLSPAEFWGAVTAIGEGSLTLQTESGSVLVLTGEAEFVGTPFVGVKVWVLGYKRADGSYLALKVTVKTADIYGTVKAIEGGILTVFKEGTTYTVRTDANTAYPSGAPFVEAQVFVKSYRMADGTYLAREITVKDWVFTGVLTSHLPEQFTIFVDTGSGVREVRYEFADVFGTLDVGKTVEVHVDHTEGAIHFAKLVKVLY